MAQYTVDGTSLAGLRELSSCCTSLCQLGAPLLIARLFIAVTGLGRMRPTIIVYTHHIIQSATESVSASVSRKVTLDAAT